MDRLMTARPRQRSWFWAGLACLALASCEEGAELPAFLTPKPDADAAETKPAARQPGKKVSREVEAPEVFAATEAGLWDGRPSLGGVWVAHPGVQQPERVRIVNKSNDKTIEGALFRRERDTPGPRFQVSSDAAAELGMIAGAPVELQVVALRQEEIEVAPPAPEPAPEPEATPEPADAPAQDTPAENTTIASAAAAIDAAEPSPQPAGPVDLSLDAPVHLPDSKPVADAPQTETAAEEPRARAGLFGLRKPFVEAANYNVRDNATAAADELRNLGIEARVVPGSDDASQSWRVLAGPANSRSDRTALMTAVKSAGFPNALPVSN